MNRSQLAVGVRVAVVVAILAIPAYSQFGGLSLVFVPGVDSEGNLASELGAEGFGKTYFDEASGVILQIAAARVTNEFGTSAFFPDIGVVLIDPLSGASRTATSDWLFVGSPRGWLKRHNGSESNQACAAQFAVYDPGAVTGTGTDTGTGTETGTGTGTDTFTEFGTTTKTLPRPKNGTGTSTSTSTSTSTQTSTSGGRGSCGAFGLGWWLGRPG